MKVLAGLEVTAAWPTMACMRRTPGEQSRFSTSSWRSGL
jgi:hypothetical protein